MSFLNRVLDPPSYGFSHAGVLVVPSRSVIFHEFLGRLNIFSSKKNWLALVSWIAAFALVIPFFIFIFNYFSWPLLFLGLIYSMVVLGSHGTLWFHRYATHRAYKFKKPIWRFIVRNLVIKIIPDETYVISHHVHHLLSERPGDPYNTHAGWLYCFLADANHQRIAQNLSEMDYARLTQLLNHTGVRVNSYEQYQRWGSLCHPLYTVLHYLLNWIFWYLTFFWIGGHALATAVFGMSVVWAFGVRTFNYDGHGRGKNLQRSGIDFYTKDLSINRIWPGYVAGEWHNNHHLFPGGARSGFLPYQFDLPWLWIRFLELIGWVIQVRDYKAQFLNGYYLPWLAKAKNQKVGTTFRRPYPTEQRTADPQRSAIHYTHSQ